MGCVDDGKTHLPPARRRIPIDQSLDPMRRQLAQAEQPIDRDDRSLLDRHSQRVGRAPADRIDDDERDHAGPAEERCRELTKSAVEAFVEQHGHHEKQTDDGKADGENKNEHRDDEGAPQRERYIAPPRCGAGRARRVGERNRCHPHGIGRRPLHLELGESLLHQARSYLDSRRSRSVPASHAAPISADHASTSGPLQARWSPRA